MPSMRAYVALALVAGSVVTAVPANVRREEATTSYLGYIVSQVAALLDGAGGGKYTSLVMEAANSLVDEDGHQKDVDAKKVMKAMLEKLDDSNDASSAASLASQIQKLIVDDEFPTEAATLVDEIGSDLTDSKENSNIATVVSNLVEFVADLRSAVPTLFEDEPETDENTATTKSDEEETNETKETPNKDDDGSSDTGTNSASRSYIAIGSLSMGVAVGVFSSMF